MPAEFIALLAAVSYALFTVCGWFGLTYASALVATLVRVADVLAAVCLDISSQSKYRLAP
jgi:uncharacterized membrane protein